MAFHDNDTQALADMETYRELHRAAREDDLSTIKQLVRKLDINHQDRDGRTVLIDAIQYDHPKIVRYLLVETKANPEHWRQQQ